MHSGIGRISKMKMFPMSLFESNDSNGKIPLTYLFNNPNTDVHNINSDISLQQIIFLTCRDGWPSSLFMTTDKEKLFVSLDYVNSLIDTEISNIDQIKEIKIKQKYF